MHLCLQFDLIRTASIKKNTGRNGIFRQRKAFNDVNGIYYLKYLKNLLKYNMDMGLIFNLYRNQIGPIIVEDQEREAQLG